MLGGGQLGRMFTVAARTLGYRVIVLEPDPQSPAGQLADQHIQATYDDAQALEQLGKACDVITTEFENIPAQTLKTLAQYCPVYPSAEAVQVTQDRIKEKKLIQSCILETVPYMEVHNLTELHSAEHHISFPAILKTARLGYDGKGQTLVNSQAEAITAFKNFKLVPCVLEQFIDYLDCEISVVLGRNQAGEVQCFPVAENEHYKGILYQTRVPARISPQIEQQAIDAATDIANELNFVGVMAVEFFVTLLGELLVNEIAPRPHNSGHYTLDACVTSQFEQQVRMVCGLPFGSTRLVSPVVMINLLGDLWPEGGQPDWLKVFNDPETKLHLYGKASARKGRKMGHYCTLAATVDEASMKADTIFQQLARVSD
jgi:5-(carboxyamino)imidazole ribonucleotide synthase